MNTGVVFSICLFVAVVIIWVVMTFRTFAQLKNGYNEAFKGVMYYFDRRRNLVDDLTKLLKKQMPEEEADVVRNVVDARNLAKNASSRVELFEAEGVLAQTLETLFDAVERYPEISGSKRYKSLHEKIGQMNDGILKAGKLYNNLVKLSNSRIRMFPTKLVAKMFNFVEQPML